MESPVILFVFFLFLIYIPINAHKCLRHHNKIRNPIHYPEENPPESRNYFYYDSETQTRRKVNPFEMKYEPIPFEMQIFFSKLIHTNYSKWIPQATKALRNVEHFLNLAHPPSAHGHLEKCGFPNYFDDDEEYETTHDHQKNRLFDFEGHFAIFIHLAHGDDPICNAYSNETLGYSYNCQGSRITWRPLTGLMVLCSTFWEYIEEMGMGILDHELKHTLGFASEHFQHYPRESKIDSSFLGKYNYINREKRLKVTFRSNNGAYPVPERKRKFRTVTSKDPQKIMKRGRKYWGKGVINHYLGIKESTQLLREFFECESLSGVPLSNDGNHLHNLYFVDDYMTPLIEGSKNLNSKIVYTILKESGWYTLRNTDELTMGKWLEGGIGCDVLTKNCYDLWLHSKYGNSKTCWHHAPRTWYTAWKDWPGMKRLFGPTKCLDKAVIQWERHLVEKYFCFDPADKENCNLIRHEKNIKDEYRYFKYPKLGGQLGMTMEYCPIHLKWDSID